MAFNTIFWCIETFSFLDPGEVPEIRGVTRYVPFLVLAQLRKLTTIYLRRFPAQEHVGGDSKIPTIIYYDKQGRVCAVGAEATREGIEVQAEEEGWTKAEW